MDDFNNYSFRSEESSENASSYRTRKGKFKEERGKKNRRFLPPILILILVTGLTMVWYLSGLSPFSGTFFSPGEKTVMISLPEALLAESNNKEAISEAVGEESIKEGAQDESGILTFTLNVETKDDLLEKAKLNLMEKIAALKDKRQHPYIVDLNYDTSYRELSLVVDRKKEQYDQILVTVSELYMLVAFYRQIHTGTDSSPERLITIEDAGNGDVLEQLTYPDDLTRMAEILISAKAPVETILTPQPGDKVIVTTGVDNLNLRNGPEITYLIIDILRSGTILEVIGAEGIWLQVITPEGREGWVHGGYVKILN